MPFGLALPGRELELRQVDLRQVATERAAQAEGPGGSIQRGLEVAQVLAIGVRDFAVEAAQRHLWLVDQRIEAMPGKSSQATFASARRPSRQSTCPLSFRLC